MKNSILIAAKDMAVYTLQTLQADGLYLLISIFVAVALSVYLNPESTRKFFMKHDKSLIPGSVGFGAFTPLCACGTMAVVISLLTTTLPWGPIMAFLVSSPLMSPDTFILISGFMGIKFAIALAVSSLIIGLFAGYFTVFLEKKTSLLKDQLRIVESNEETRFSEISTSCCNPAKVQQLTMITGAGRCTLRSIEIAKPEQYYSPVVSDFLERFKVKAFLHQFYRTGIVKILPLFLLFVMIAHVFKSYVPMEWIIKIFNGNNFFAVPLAALVGLPLYISDAAIAPLIQVLKDSGASQGSLLAFMISGPGTSLAVIVGLNIVMKRKAILLYILYIFLGAIILGYAYDYLNFNFLH